MLRRSNFEITTALSADEALKLHKEQLFDLIVADLEMPVMGGDKLCAHVRSDPDYQSVSFLMVCSAKKSDMRKCESAGANAVITRPVDPEEFQEKVSSLLNIPRRGFLRVLIKVSVQGKFKTEPFFCTSQDISASGISIDTDRILAREDRISCAFFVPDSERLVVEGEVVRVTKLKGKEFRYGVKFLDMAPDVKIAISMFVRKRLEAEGQ